LLWNRRIMFARYPAYDDGVGVEDVVGALNRGLEGGRQTGRQATGRVNKGKRMAKSVYVRRAWKVAE
jgi:hypothetical protein